jgi:chromosome segregation ATPase
MNDELEEILEGLVEVSEGLVASRREMLTQLVALKTEVDVVRSQIDAVLRRSREQQDQIGVLMARIHDLEGRS